MYSRFVALLAVSVLCVASGFEILEKCPGRERGLSCYKACRADDCMILSKVERAVLRFGDPVAVLKNKTLCLDKMLKDAKKRKCYNRADFNKAVTKLTSLYLKHYSSLDFADNFRITLDGRNGSFVKLDTTVPTNKFTLCVKYSAMSTSLTELASYSAGRSKVWSLSVSNDTAVFRMQGGESVFTLPPHDTPTNSSSLNDSATLCLAHKSNPAIQTHLWFRYTKSGMLSKLQPSQTIPATGNAVYSKGVLTVGGVEDSAVQFTGNVSRLALTGDHAQSVDTVLPFLQCYNDPYVMLRTKLALASPTVQWSDVRTLGQYSGGAMVQNMTAGERVEVCGVTCEQCSVQCAGVTSCEGLAQCASCEQHGLCLGDSSKPLQKKYKKKCDRPAKRKCTVNALRQCLIDGTMGNNGCGVLKCLEKLGKCSERTVARLKQSADYLLLERIRQCPRFGLIKRKLNLKVPKTESKCTTKCDKQFPRYPFLRPTEESCHNFLSYRECLDSCKICQTTDCYRLQENRAFNVPFMLHNYKNYGCKFPPVCEQLYTEEVARQRTKYGIDVAETMGSEFDYLFFRFDSDLTPEKLAKMCPDDEN